MTEKTPISQDELRHYLRYFAVTTGAWSLMEEWSKPFGYHIVNPKKLSVDLSEVPGNLCTRERCYVDPNSTLKTVIYENDNEVVITFGARSSLNTEVNDENLRYLIAEKQTYNVVKNLVGLRPKCYEQADKLVEQIVKSNCFKGKKIILSGQCIGGAIAQYVGLRNKLETICINGLGIGPGLQEKIKDETLAEASKYVTHLCAETDFISDPSKLVTSADQIATTVFGVRTAGNFGKRYIFPSAYKDTNNSHIFPFASAVHFLGYPKRTKPPKLKAKDIVV